jgi:hypothetical protein
VPADRTDLYQRPAVDATDEATQALPAITARPKPDRPAAAIVPAPLAFIDDESTQALPVSVRRPADAAPGPAGRTEVDMRRDRIADAPQDPPGSIKTPPAFDDERTVIGPPMRVVLPSNPETTMILPATGEHTFGRIDPAGPDPTRQSSRSPATSTDPAAPRSSSHLQRILIAINLCVALALIVIAWATLW